MMATEAAVTRVQVNDENGNSLGNVLVGDTKTQALDRLNSYGGLFDKSDLGMLKTDVIVLDNGPYVLKKEATLQQHGKLRCCSRILVFKCCFEYMYRMVS
jgi:hypothetical protein